MARFVVTITRTEVRRLPVYVDAANAFDARRKVQNQDWDGELALDWKETGDPWTSSAYEAKLVEGEPNEKT